MDAERKKPVIGKLTICGVTFPVLDIKIHAQQIQMSSADAEFLDAFQPPGMSPIQSAIAALPWPPPMCLN